MSETGSASYSAFHSHVFLGEGTRKASARPGP